MSGFLEELKWRGMIHDLTPGVEEVLQKGKVVGYIGFDPTAPSLTIGNYVQLMLLQFFQKHGHQPIALMGGATGRIGDPSGKDKERTLKSYDELDLNLERQIKEVKQALNFEECENQALLENNYNFYKDMNVLDFLRDVGKSITINYMTSKESVKKRIETGLSFTEFSYQLLQAYDFQCLYEKYNCVLQMGGSDQWGNITSGSEFIRRNLGAKAYAVTTPLLTKADGAKFGKSEQENIWLNGEMTTPYQFYQFWINADDRDLPKFIRYFSLKEREEVESLEKEYESDPRGLKKILAEELTRRIHGDNSYDAVLKVSELLFSKKMSLDFLQALDYSIFEALSKEIPAFEINRSTINGGIGILDLLADATTIVGSKGEARRAVSGNAISVNKQKIQSLDHEVSREDFLHGEFCMIENGKKNKFMVVAR
jgi:tyrosyl-tRNA synthetase